MQFRRLLFAAAVAGLCLGSGVAQAGTGDLSQRQPFPFEGPDPLGRERLGENSAGRPVETRALHNESWRVPPIDKIPDDLTIPVPKPDIRRYYITCYYYGVRPWFLDVYRGTDLVATDLVSSVEATNPDWLALARNSDGTPKKLEELLKDNDTLGEPLVTIEDGGIVDETNKDQVDAWKAEQAAEFENASDVGVQLNERVQEIQAAPFYGLYCLRVRFCIPILNPNNHLTRAPYRVWCRFLYKRHQRVCWRRWWFHRWRFIGNAWSLYPWRPWCTPNFVWSRSGPGWVLSLTSANRYRRWCLYGFRYYFLRWGTPPFNLNRLPRIASLASALKPPGGDISTSWLRPWPYPRVRYWPFRPYCSRWWRFRCVPWLWYRHFPPIVHFAAALPNDANGGGFRGLSDAAFDRVNLLGDFQTADAVFPDDPPNLADGAAHDPRGPFSQIFDAVGECRYRPLEETLGDNDGDGTTRTADFGRPLRLERLLDVNPDTKNEDRDDNPG